MKPLVAAALFLLAGQAVAQEACPTNADLADGIRLTRAEPFFSVLLTETEEGLAEARIMEQDGVPQEVSSVYSHPLTVIRRIGPNSTLELFYAEETGELDSLPGPRQWSSRVALLSEGETINRGTYTAQLTGSGEADVGGCSYAVWRIRETLTLEGMEMMAFEKAYAPELGLVLSSIRLAPDGSPVSSVFFDEITAE